MAERERAWKDLPMQMGLRRNTGMQSLAMLFSLMAVRSHGAQRSKNWLPCPRRRLNTWQPAKLLAKQSGFDDSLEKSFVHSRSPPLSSATTRVPLHSLRTVDSM